MRIGKGYALDFLFERLRASGAFARYDGFFFFDADNLLHEDFIAEMNKSFAAGNRIITSYRNSKNYGDNWISAGYSLWFLRDAQYMNNPRMQLKTSSVVGGTGFLVAREVIEKNGGWPFHLLTEDTEFTIDSVLSGEFIAYCGNAILYDEQPTSFRQSWRQRLRWSRGYLQVLHKYGARLVSGVFRGGKRGYACFDMLMAILPAIVLTLACALLNAGGALYSLIVLREPVLGTLCGELLRWFGGMYITLLATGAVTLASEWKRIYCGSFRKVFFLFTFPLFMMTYLAGFRGRTVPEGGVEAHPPQCEQNARGLAGRSLKPAHIKIGGGAERTQCGAGCSEAEAQEAREHKEAAPAATRRDHCAPRSSGKAADGGGGPYQRNLRE